MAMPILTLLEKAYGPVKPETFEASFAALCEGLKVQLKVVGGTARGWIQVDVSGEDSAVAARFLDQEIGLTPTSANELRKFSVLRGRVISSRKSEQELYVDVGVFSPKTCDAALPLPTLRAQLADGKQLPLKQLKDLYCLYGNLPLQVKLVSEVDATEGMVEAELSEGQLSLFTRWLSLFLDRLIVLGAEFRDVERAVKIAKHTRDVVRVEQLGLLEHGVVCKLGTDAVGLVPRLGRFLRSATLVPFSPRKIKSLIGRLRL